MTSDDKRNLNDAQSNDAQSNESDALRAKSESRMMFIFSAVVVLLILGMMGANVMFSDQSQNASPEISSQSRTAPAE